MLSSLPIDQVLPELTAALQSANCVVLRAPAAPGVKVTVKVMLAPGVSDVGAGETTAKSPALGPSRRTVPPAA